MTKPTLPYGSWPSPISVEMAVGASHELSEPRPDGDDLYFLESRPAEAGRVVLMRRTGGGTFGDVVPDDMNVRTRVHEYGGGSYAVEGGLVVFSEFAGNRLMLKRRPAATLEALTDDPKLRFADMEIDAKRERVLAVLEDHRESDSDPRNILCSVALVDGAITELAVGPDFISNPRLSPGGSRIAWLSWDHPNMPWDGTDLWVADVAADGTLGSADRIAGGLDEAVMQPVWAPDGSLVFISDRSGWWNPYRWTAGSGAPQPLIPAETEFGGPQWVFGLSDVDVDADGSVVAAAIGPEGTRLLAVSQGGAQRELDTDGRSVAYLRVSGGVATYIAGSPTRPSAIESLDLATGVRQTLRESAPLEVDPTYLSVPEHIEYPTSGGRTSHALYYPPANPDADGPAGEAPPLVVMSHGGPTSNVRSSLNLARQAFTSRGFAVVDVDYGGSTGYGRAYRRQLSGTWGQVDVDDCTNAALWLAEQGRADRGRLAIRGGSAGGFTTLAALAFGDVFSAGTSFYGVGDLEALTRFTHKFEARYLDGLLGPYPEAVDVYRERSPIHHVDDISCPVLVMQGTDDLVVPQAQADEIVAALARNGLAHAYLLFEGEGHGFRQGANQRRALEAELSFYAQIFGFDLADAFEPLEVIGLDR
jgi:dipeptidyl aminopeptidase/acylaminoacyl peptidase